MTQNTSKKTDLSKSLGTIFIWITLFLPIFSLSNCQNSATQIQEDQYETFYGYQLLLGIDGTPSPQHPSEPKTISEALSDHSGEYVTVVFYGLTLLTAGFAFWVRRPQIDLSPAEQIVRNGAAAAFCTAGVVLFWILELGTSMMFVLYKAREIGSVLIYLGFSLTIIQTVRGYTPLTKPEGHLDHPLTQRIVRIVIVLTSFLFTFLICVLGLFLALAVVEDGATGENLVVFGPTLFMCFFLCATQLLLTLRTNTAAQQLTLDRTKPMLAAWAAPYLLLIVIFLWAGIFSELLD